MNKKDELITVRINKEFKAFLKKKARKRGVSLSKLLFENLHDSYQSDKEQILGLINKKKEENPTFWKELDKSKIINEFEEHIATMYTEFINPISSETEHQPVLLLVWISNFISETIKHFESIPEEHKQLAASHFIRMGETLVDGLGNVKSKDKKTQEEIINMKANLVDKMSYHLTALAFAKESYMKIKKEIGKVKDELIKNLND